LEELTKRRDVLRKTLEEVRQQGTAVRYTVPSDLVKDWRTLCKELETPAQLSHANTILDIEGRVNAVRERWDRWKTDNASQVEAQQSGVEREPNTDKREEETLDALIARIGAEQIVRRIQQRTSVTPTSIQSPSATGHTSH
jgi:hypothetical protein